MARDPPTRPEGTSPETCYEVLKEERLDHLFLVNDAGELVSMASRQEWRTSRNVPAPGAPSLSKDGRLLCGAAVGTRCMLYWLGIYVESLIILISIYFSLSLYKSLPFFY